jgi:cytochrome c551/c552
LSLPRSGSSLRRLTLEWWTWFGFQTSSWLARLARSLGCGLLLAPITLTGAIVRIELPPETAAFKPGPGSEIANGQCLICHSVEYVTTQPAFPRAFWAATVKKMQEKYGAPLPEAQVEPLVAYLTKHYGVETNVPAAPTASSVAATPAVPKTGEAIATKYGCLGCHNVSAKVVGPSYKDIAAKYNRGPQALARISEQIHKGGSGKWGPIIMPPFPTVTDAETKALADWILSQN